MRSVLLVSACALVATGCIDTDAAVFVEPSLVAPVLALSTSPLATALSGEARLELHLGPRASGPSTTGVTALSLVSADGSRTLAPSLGFTASPTLPTTVAIDSTAAVALAFAAADNTLPASGDAALCAGPVRMRAVVDDSLRGVAVTCDSEPFAVSGCP